MVGPKVFEVEDVDQLVPQLREIFDEVAGLRRRAKQLKLRINALELIWGSEIQDDENPDHGELEHHLEELQKVQEEFESAGRQVAELGGQLKGLDPPLVDFYGVRDGHLVVWCWTAADETVGHWHHVDEGFEQREPL